MFKIAKSSLAEVKDVMRQVYEEAPQHWPNGLGIEWFDGGVWAVKEAQTGKVAGFVGWQVRFERAPGTRAFQKVGYYSVGILPEHRRNGFAKEALEKLIAMKSATCDRVRAMICASNKPSQALADVLGVEKMIKGAQTTGDRAAESIGAGASLGAAGGILSTGLGKATPSFLDLSHRMFTGPSGEELFQGLAAHDPASALRLKMMAKNNPFMFKMALLGVRVPGVDAKTQQKLMEYGFGIRPSGSRLGDVLVNGPTSEITGGMSRLRHALSGGAMHHTAIGLPENMDQWAFLAGRNQGVQNWKGNLSDMGHASVVLRPKNPVYEDRMTNAVNEAFDKPYSYARLRRLAAQEVVSSPWSDKSAPTLLEKGLTAAGKNVKLRRWLGIVPGLKDQMLKSRMATRCMPGHTCSTAIGEALQKGAPGTLSGRSAMGVTPSDLLRGVGKDFDVAALNLPSRLATKPQLILNHLMKAGPMATRLAVASPFIAGAAYLGNKAFQPPPAPPSWMDNLRSRFGW